MNSPSHKCQSGFSLLESLVAMLITALGVLAILGFQLRTLADNQTGVRRAQAVRLIEDLSEKIRANPDGLNNLAFYVVGWGPTGTPQNCKTAACLPGTLALHSAESWKRSVETSLPTGDANVFLVADDVAMNARQLGVMISWRENERQREDDTAGQNAAYVNVFATTSTGGANVTCPAGRICHLQYIQPNGRCFPHTAAAAVSPPLFCAQ